METNKEIMTDEELKTFFKRHWPLMALGVGFGTALFFVSAPAHLALFALYGVKYLR